MRTNFFYEKLSQNVFCFVTLKQITET